MAIELIITLILLAVTITALAWVTEPTPQQDGPDGANPNRPDRRRPSAPMEKREYLNRIYQTQPEAARGVDRRLLIMGLGYFMPSRMPIRAWVKYWVNVAWYPHQVESPSNPPLQAAWQAFLVRMDAGEFRDGREPLWVLLDRPSEGRRSGSFDPRHACRGSRHHGRLMPRISQKRLRAIRDLAKKGFRAMARFPTVELVRLSRLDGDFLRAAKADRAIRLDHSEGKKYFHVVNAPLSARVDWATLAEWERNIWRPKLAPCARALREVGIIPEAWPSLILNGGWDDLPTVLRTFNGASMYEIRDRLRDLRETGIENARLQQEVERLEGRLTMVEEWYEQSADETMKKDLQIGELEEALEEKDLEIRMLTQQLDAGRTGTGASGDGNIPMGVIVAMMDYLHSQERRLPGEYSLNERLADPVGEVNRLIQVLPQRVWNWARSIQQELRSAREVIVEMGRALEAARETPVETITQGTRGMRPDVVTSRHIGTGKATLILHDEDRSIPDRTEIDEVGERFSRLDLRTIEAASGAEPCCERKLEMCGPMRIRVFTLGEDGVKRVLCSTLYAKNAEEASRLAKSWGPLDPRVAWEEIPLPFPDDETEPRCERKLEMWDADVREALFPTPPPEPVIVFEPIPARRPRPRDRFELVDVGGMVEAYGPPVRAELSWLDVIEECMPTLRRRVPGDWHDAATREVEGPLQDAWLGSVTMVMDS